MTTMFGKRGLATLWLRRTLILIRFAWWVGGRLLRETLGIQKRA